MLEEWAHQYITLTAMFAFDWKVLIFSLLSFRIISFFAYLPIWMTLLTLYARSIAFFWLLSNF